MYVRWNNGGFSMLLMIFYRSLRPRDLKAWVCGCLFAGIVGSNPAEGGRFVSLVIVVCCQVDVCATSRSFVQRSPTDCGVSECHHDS